MITPIELTVEHLLPYFEDHELLLIETEDGTELYSNYATAGREEYKLADDIDEDLLELKIVNIFSTDLGELLLIVKE